MSGRKRINENLRLVVMEQSMGKVTKPSSRARSTGVSEMKVLEDRVINLVSNSDSAQAAEKEKPLKHNSVGAEEEKPSVGGEELQDKEVEYDLDSVTTVEWFDRMGEYLPLTINMVA